MRIEQFKDSNDEKIHFFALGIVSFVFLILSFYLAVICLRRPVSAGRLELVGTINPNSASVESLERLPGIGPAKAQAIVSFRQHFAGLDPNVVVFQGIESLQEVNGIGPATVQKMKPFLRFD